MPCAPHSSRALQVSRSTSPSLTPGIITAAPVNLMFSQNILQALSASSGCWSLTHSLLSSGDDEKIVNEDSGIPKPIVNYLNENIKQSAEEKKEVAIS